MDEAFFRKLKAQMERKQRSFNAIRQLIDTLPSIDFSRGVHHNTALQAVVHAAADEARRVARSKKLAGSPETAKRRAFNLKVVKYIIEKGASIDQADEAGCTALWYAAAGYAEILALLIQHGALPNQRKPGAITPLMVACMARQIENVRLLLEAGADPNAQLESGETAGHLAKDAKVRALLQKFGGAPPPTPSTDPLRDAREGKVAALRAMADGDSRSGNDAAAYRWLCVAADFGHPKAAQAAADVLETTSMRFDDDHAVQARVHSQLAQAYRDGAGGLQRDLARARAHEKLAAKMLGRNQSTTGS